MTTNNDPTSKNCILTILDESEALPFIGQDGSIPNGIQILRDRKNPSKTQRIRKFKEEMERAERIFNEVSKPEPKPEPKYGFDPCDCIIPA